MNLENRISSRDNYKKDAHLELITNFNFEMYFLKILNKNLASVLGGGPGK